MPSKGECKNDVGNGNSDEGLICSGREGIVNETLDEQFEQIRMQFMAVHRRRPRDHAAHPASKKIKDTMTPFLAVMHAMQ